MSKIFSLKIGTTIKLNGPDLVTKSLDQENMVHFDPPQVSKNGSKDLCDSIYLTCSSSQAHMK